MNINNSLKVLNAQVSVSHSSLTHDEAGAANASKRLSCDVTSGGSKVDTINTGICALS